MKIVRDHEEGKLRQPLLQGVRKGEAGGSAEMEANIGNVQEVSEFQNPQEFWKACNCRDRALKPWGKVRSPEWKRQVATWCH